MPLPARQYPFPVLPRVLPGCFGFTPLLSEPQCAGSGARNWAHLSGGQMNRTEVSNVAVRMNRWPLLF
eukprot:2802634-Alexandrium_andersonii.AAC.1